MEQIKSVKNDVRKSNMRTAVITIIRSTLEVMSSSGYVFAQKALLANKMLLQVVVILFMSLLTHQIQIPLFSGKKQVFIIDEVRQCADQGSKAILWDIKMKRVSRQQVVLQGNITMTVPLDDKVAGGIEVSEKGNGGWISQGYVFKLPHLCADVMLLLGSGWISFWEKAGISPSVTCPIPKGNYFLKDFPTSDIFKRFPGMKQGTFKTNMVFLNTDNSRLGCVEFIVHT